MCFLSSCKKNVERWCYPSIDKEYCGAVLFLFCRRSVAVSLHPCGIFEYSSRCSFLGMAESHLAFPLPAIGCISQNCFSCVAITSLQCLLITAFRSLFCSTSRLGCVGKSS